MTFFLLNIVLAVIWAALSGELTVENLVGGFVIGYGALWIGRTALKSENYVSKVGDVISFTLFFLRELIFANLRIAWEVLTPGYSMRPAIVAIPLDLTNETAILLLANVITLTPGTLSLDTSVDRSTLYVHAMYVDDVEAFRDSIKQGFEQRIKELFE